MNTRKILISLAFIVASILSVSLLWENTPTLIVVLLVLAVLKHRIIPIKHEALWFLIIGFIGAGGESVIMRISGAWSYASPELINIPFWLPFLWGLAGTIAISLYEGISRKK